jgi:hypothetical protein
MVSVSGYLIGSQAANQAPLPPAAELSWWYQYYFATERGLAGYDRYRDEFNRLIWQSVDRPGTNRATNRLAGIFAWVSADDAGGVYPFQLGDGAHVVIHERDRELAESVFASETPIERDEGA